MPPSAPRNTRDIRNIAEYERKRDFTRTPEPPPGSAAASPEPQFVVHRHEARRLHYDLRLEMRGVLKSWAVPKGFSYDPTVRKLAVRTEDHPLSYTEFHGVIPEGEYGGGTMGIWDGGPFRITEGGEEDGIAGVRDGKLVVELRGRKLRGAWHLVRTARGESEWLLFKGRDRYVRAETDRQPFFDLTGATRWTGDPPPEPVRPSGERPPFSDPGWLFEPELAGVPAFLEQAPEGARLLPAAPGDRLPDAPEILEDANRLRAEEALIFGTLVATDRSERPSMERMRERLAGDASVPVSFYALDLLRYEQWDIRETPLIERKSLLATLLPDESPRLLMGEHVRGRGEELHRACEAAGLPGAIARKAEGAYSAPDCARIPSRSEGAEAEHLLAGLSARRAERERARPAHFTNLDKVFWPELGYTKGDLIRYYDQVAEHLLPHLHERPAHLLRLPDGIGGKAFYQKDLPEHAPDWLETETIASGRGETIRYLIVNDPDALLFAANLGSIDIHPWLSVRSRRDIPDWAVFDLDPGGASPFSDVVKLARAFGKVLRGIGLRPCLKTSGASGLHVYVPLEPIYPYEAVRQFCEAVSTWVAAHHPDIATVERAVERRGGRVYLDFLQNRRGQTVVPPYAARPVPAASVSAPLDWDELDAGIAPDQFTIRTMPDRLRRLGDLFAPALHDRQPLLPAIQRFSERYLDSSSS